jgi:ParB family chromosome partitioning protein
MSDSSKEAAYKKGKIYPIPLDALKPDPTQPRKHIDDSELGDLKDSIETHGLLSPIIFRVDQDNILILVSGERRYRACQALGKTHINGIFIDSEKYDEIALVDNVQREDLHPVDLAEAVKALKDRYEYTDKAVGNIIGKAHTTVSEILKLNDLSQEIRDDARKRKNLSRNVLLKVARKKKEAAQRKAYDALLASLTKEGKEIKRPRHPAHQKAVAVSDKAIKLIEKIDLNDLGDNKEEVEAKLRELLTAIQNKLDSTAG